VVYAPRPGIDSMKLPYGRKVFVQIVIMFCLMQFPSKVRYIWTIILTVLETILGFNGNKKINRIFFYVARARERTLGSFILFKFSFHHSTAEPQRLPRILIN
jgi:hypothetical protein